MSVDRAAQRHYGIGSEAIPCTACFHASCVVLMVCLHSTREIALCQSCLDEINRVTQKGSPDV